MLSVKVPDPNFSQTKDVGSRTRPVVENIDEREAWASGWRTSGRRQAIVGKVVGSRRRARAARKARELTGARVRSTSSLPGKPRRLPGARSGASRTLHRRGRSRRAVRPRRAGNRRTRRFQRLARQDPETSSARVSTRCSPRRDRHADRGAAPASGTEDFNIESALSQDHHHDGRRRRRFAYPHPVDDILTGRCCS